MRIFAGNCVSALQIILEGQDLDLKTQNHEWICRYVIIIILMERGCYDKLVYSYNQTVLGNQINVWNMDLDKISIVKHNSWNSTPRLVIKYKMS